MEQAQAKAAAKKAKKQRQKASKLQAQAQAQQAVHGPSATVLQQLMPEAKEALHKLHLLAPCSEAPPLENPALQQPTSHTQLSTAEPSVSSVDQCCAASPAAELHTPYTLPEQHKLQQTACSSPDSKTLFRQHAADSDNGCEMSGLPILGDTLVSKHVERAGRFPVGPEASATEQTTNVAATVAEARDTAAASATTARAGSVATAELRAADALAAQRTTDARDTFEWPTAAAGHSARADALHRKCSQYSGVLQQWAQCPITQVCADALPHSIDCQQETDPMQYLQEPCSATSQAAKPNTA